MEKPNSRACLMNTSRSNPAALYRILINASLAGKKRHCHVCTRCLIGGRSFAEIFNLVAQSAGQLGVFTFRHVIKC